MANTEKNHQGEDKNKHDKEDKHGSNLSEAAKKMHSGNKHERHDAAVEMGKAGGSHGHGSGRHSKGEDAEDDE